MSVVGINIGALTVKAVALRGDDRDAVMAAHQGRPLDVLSWLLAAPQFAEANFFGVSGALGHITEVAAIQRALRETNANFDAVASLGGESFLVYILANDRIANVLSHNKCAAGSGEFFVQQIGRMGLSLDEAIRNSFAGKVVPLASRCSVHCKSRYHTQAQPPRSHARGCPALLARQHGEQGHRAPRQRAAGAAARAFDWRCYA